MVAGLAGLVFVSLAAWQVPGWQEQFGAGPLLAQGVPAVPQGGPASAPFAAAQAPGAEPPSMIRDAQLDALLAAHKQFGGASALQGPAGFLRSATFEGKAP
jgi:sigma-E factor negative regulatory protein RseA